MSEEVSSTATVASRRALKARVEAGEPLALGDWRAGASIVVVDVVSPFAEGVSERLLAGAKHAEGKE
jgi:cytolysin-activating lysine-acyltransferase